MRDWLSTKASRFLIIAAGAGVVLPASTLSLDIVIQYGLLYLALAVVVAVAGRIVARGKRRDQSS